MMNWTDEARNELERFLVAERAWLAADPDSEDVDHEEVIADLRAHVREELTAKGVTEVDYHCLQEVLERLRPGFGGANEPVPKRSEPDFDFIRNPPQGKRKRRSGVWAWLFGVVIPLIALFLEMATGVCRGMLGTGVSPVPTPLYALLILLVPVMNAMMLLRISKQQKSGRTFMVFVGMACLVNAVYMLLFLPAIPIGLFGLLFGLGVLPLSPFLSMFVLAPSMKRMKRAGSPSGALVGGFLAMGLIVAVEIPAIVTTVGANMAADSDPEKSARGVELIRSYGSESVLLSTCYGLRPTTLFFPTARSTTDWWGEEDSLDRPNAIAARTTYFRVTGRAFNSMPVPDNVSRNDKWTRNRMEDADRGGDEVAGRIGELTMTESRLDTVIETGASLSYTEWEMLFSNSSDFAKEARAQVLLPPGGFVTRLTLWVDGEEREAAFDTRKKVKAAYREVAVVRRRDPVLVNTSGEDLILVQCFPVPANGDMRIRVGITSPLLLGDSAEGREGTLRLPSIVEHNFDIPESLDHEIWVQGASEFLVIPSGVESLIPAQGPVLARGALGDDALSDPASAIRVSLAKAPTTSWAEESFYDESGSILQTLEEREAEPVGRIVFVIDGSVAMAPAAEDLAFALSLIPRDIDVSLAICGDGSGEIEALMPADSAQVQRMVARLEEHGFAGGAESASTLAKAFDAAQAPGGSGETRAGAVVWIHGEQPVHLAGAGAISQRLTRARDGTQLFAIRGIGGLNKLAAELGGLVNFERAPRTGELTNDLARLVRKLTLGGPQATLVRTHVSRDSVPEGARKVSRNLARIWAGNESVRLQRTSITVDREEGIQLALAHHLVTKATGAVVLENAEQYARHDLAPVKIDVVPSVPEPETWAMILMVAGLLGFAVIRGRSAA